MYDTKYALEIMKQELGNKYISPEIKYAFKASIGALKKQESFENEVLVIREWFVDNKDGLYDSADRVGKEAFEMLTGQYKVIDEVDLEAITEDIVDEIQKGILNVLDTFKDD